MKIEKKYKLVLINDDDKVLNITTQRNLYDTELKMFDSESLKKQLSDPRVSRHNYALYGEDYHLIYAYLNKEILDFQGYENWAVVKRYLEVRNDGVYFKTKQLKRRYKDIEREFEKKLERGILDKAIKR